MHCKYKGTIKTLKLPLALISSVFGENKVQIN